ncbi:MAG: CPBP family glutamic-type intramembrane protease [Bacteroidetes bacterium]|nr:CPBP family glutamic-type intramembrane protease [Bacteroidota bacterium]
MQPELQKKFSTFQASIFIGIIWLSWHIPLFWLEGAAQQGGSFVSFALSVFSMSFLFSWLYVKTNGSSFFAVLFHTSINYASALIVPFLIPSSNESKIFGIVFTIVLIVTAVLFAVRSRKLFMLKLEN